MAVCSRCGAALSQGSSCDKCGATDDSVAAREGERNKRLLAGGVLLAAFTLYGVTCARCGDVSAPLEPDPDIALAQAGAGTGNVATALDDGLADEAGADGERAAGAEGASKEGAAAHETSDDEDDEDDDIDDDAAELSGGPSGATDESATRAARSNKPNGEKRVADAGLASEANEEAQAGANDKGRVVVMVKNDIGTFYKLVSYDVSVDGRLLKRDEREEGIEAREGIVVFEGALPPGEHILMGRMNYAGSGVGIFTYVEGYKFKMRNRVKLQVTKDRVTRVTLIGTEEGPTTAEYTDRPTMRITVQNTALKTQGGQP